MRIPILRAVLLALLLLAATPAVDHPSLLVDRTRMQAIAAAVQVPGSSHAEMFALLKADVDAKAASVIAGGSRTGTNWNYARAALATEAGMLYAITGTQSYATIAYDALAAVHSDPDPGGNLPESGVGLRRATVGIGFALAYDLCHDGWTQAQRDHVRGKMILALDAWPLFTHANLNGTLGSNWVSVCRGAEMLLLLAAGEQTARASRLATIRGHLATNVSHLGNGGWGQEGSHYTPYAGIFFIPAAVADARAGNATLLNAFKAKNPHRIAMYGGMLDAGMSCTTWGVGGPNFPLTGWTSQLFAAVSPAEMGAYRWFYDRHRGRLSAAPVDKRYDPQQAGRVFALMFYPETTPAVDPATVMPVVMHDDKGGTWFRSRWQDADDVIVNILSDTSFHGEAWDESDAQTIGILGFGSIFSSGPGVSRSANSFSQVVVDGEAGPDGTTGAAGPVEVLPDGGYAIVRGGGKALKLGLTASERHLRVAMPGSDGVAILSTIDVIESQALHAYAWHLNAGALPSHLVVENGVPTFTLYGPSGGFLKGWVFASAPGTLVHEGPIAYRFTANNARVWVVMALGKGAAPQAAISGSGLASVVTIGGRQVAWDGARIQVGPAAVVQPSAAFTVSSASGPATHTVTCSAVTAGLASYQWSFGDGGAATGRTVSHGFVREGVYPVTLTVQQGGLTSRATRMITVTNVAPAVTVTATPVSGSAPLAVAFSAAGTTDPDGHAMTVTWDAGDGTAGGSGMTWQHTYAAQGLYFATCTADDGHGGVTAKSVRIQVGNQAPTIAFTLTPAVSPTPVAVAFDARASTDPENDTLSYAWDFGDGTTGSGATGSHGYAAYGTYTVTLTVQDGKGNRVVATQTITLANQAPTPSFTSTPAVANAPAQIAFNATASSDPEGQALSYAWTFGDGGSATGATPVHTFQQAGNYSVRLRVSDPLGASSDLILPVSVLTAAGQRAADDPAGVLPGIYQRIYNTNDQQSMSIVDTLYPVSAGPVPYFDIRQRPSFDQFAFLYTGYIKVPADGVYTFYYDSNESIRWRIGTTLVCERPNRNVSLRTGSGQIALQAGLHRCEAIFKASAANSTTWLPYYRLEMSGPGIARRPLQPSDLFWLPGLPTADFLVSLAPKDMLEPLTVNFLPPDPVGTRTFYASKAGQPVTVRFDAGPSQVPGGTVSAYLWDFGNGQVATGRTVSRSYAVGTHFVALTVVSSTGASARVGMTIQILDAPVVTNLVRTPIKRVVASGAYRDSNTGIFAFDGDRKTKWLDNTEQGWIECHFEQGGRRNPYLVTSYRIMNPLGWNDRNPKTIVFQGSNDGVNWTEIHVANDIAWGAEVGVSKEIAFVNTTAYASYRWDITPWAESPQGWFVDVPEIELVVASFAGQPQARSPVAEAALPATAEIAEVVQCDARPSRSPDGYPLMYFWDFGDGQTLRTFAAVVPHVYRAEGTYQVQLVARDSLGNVSRAPLRTITIGARTNRDPVAAFSVIRQAGSYRFDASASSDPDGDALTYHWEFGNGYSSLDRIATSVLQPGVSSVTLTVTDARGAVDRLTKSVTNVPATAAARVISVSWAVGENPESILLPYETAGAFPAPNWNNLTSANAGSASGLVDDTNTRQNTSLTYNMGSFAMNFTDPRITGDQRMMSANCMAGSTVTITAAAVPYPTYDVYLYHIPRIGNNNKEMQVIIGDQTRCFAVGTDAYVGSWIEATGTTRATATPNGQVAIFRGLSGSTLTITLINGTRNGLCGMQIVDRSRRLVLYDANGGEGQTPIELRSYVPGEQVTVRFDPPPIRSGATFAGWKTTRDGASAQYTSTGTTTLTMGASDLTLYAHWVGGANRVPVIAPAAAAAPTVLVLP